MDYRDLVGVIEAAGIHKTEFAAISGISRASLHEYMHGRRVPHRLTERQLVRAAALLQTNVEKGTLPPGDTSRKARRKLVARLKSQLDR